MFMTREYAISLFEKQRVYGVSNPEDIRRIDPTTPLVTNKISFRRHSLALISMSQPYLQEIKNDYTFKDINNISEIMQRIVCAYF